MKIDMNRMIQNQVLANLENNPNMDIQQHSVTQGEIGIEEHFSHNRTSRKNFQHMIERKNDMIKTLLGALAFSVLINVLLYIWNIDLRDALMFEEYFRHVDLEG